MLLVALSGRFRRVSHARPRHRSQRIAVGPWQSLKDLLSREVDVLRVLIAEGGAEQLSVPDKDGALPVHLAACNEHFLLLVEHGGVAQALVKDYGIPRRNALERGARNPWNRAQNKWFGEFARLLKAAQKQNIWRHCKHTDEELSNSGCFKFLSNSLFGEWWQCRLR